MGLDFDGHREAKRKVVEYLQACKPKDRIGLVPRTGWYKNAFVLPNRTIGISKEPLLFHTEGASLCKLSERGTLKDWQENVARFCVGNRELRFLWLDEKLFWGACAIHGLCLAH
jgi:putative DNA primase/helicase